MTDTLDPSVEPEWYSIGCVCETCRPHTEYLKEQNAKAQAEAERAFEETAKVNAAENEQARKDSLIHDLMDVRLSGLDITAILVGLDMLKSYGIKEAIRARLLHDDDSAYATAVKQVEIASDIYDRLQAIPSDEQLTALSDWVKENIGV